MKNIKKNTFGYAHHVLLGVLVVAVIVIVGIRVLAGTHAQTPAGNMSIGNAVSATPPSDQLQTLDTLDGATISDNSTAPSATELTALNSQVADAINNFRKKHGRSPLHASLKLHASSRQHSMEMGKCGYFDHNAPKRCHPPNGWAWDKRISHYYTSKGYSYWTIGENLGFWTPDVSASAALSAWAGSPEHRRNLLDPNFRELGVSAVQVPNAPGVYQGYTVTIITTDFGARH